MASTSAGVPRPRRMGRMGDAELASILRSERAAAVRTRLVEAVEGPTGKRKKTKRKEEEFLLGREEA